MLEKKIYILVNERPVATQLGFTVMQACSDAGVDIPRFCYHDKLLIAGNCRICLLEVAGGKKLVASCAVHVSDSMSVYTNTVRVKIARQNVLEFLLANHPLDCPICDQGGECDLQDITSVFGADRGRFYELEKRAVLNKDFGPLIRTSMNRCIHCTRCVRFLSLSSGVSTLGTLGRGTSTEISLYINKFIVDELSGNITDLCPVGALTSKPYSFQARPWELVSIRGVDVFDAMCSTLVFDVTANKICRILPYSNENLNECWLTNKARYAYDGLFTQRLNSCLLKIDLSDFFSDSINIFKRNYTAFIKLSWSVAFSCFFKKLCSSGTKKFITLVGNSLDLSTTYFLKIFVGKLGSSDFFIERTSFLRETSFADYNYLYLFNTTLKKITTNPSFCLLVGANLRFEAPLINFRLAQLVLSSSVPIFKIGGSILYSSYPSKLISNNLIDFYRICEFKHIFCKNFYVNSFSFKPLLLLGGSVTYLVDSVTVIAASINFLRRFSKICFPLNFDLLKLIQPRNEFTYFGVLSQFSSQIHSLDVGLVSSPVKLNSVLDYALGYNLGATFIYSVGFERCSNFFQKIKPFALIYQGAYGVGLASSSDLIFPVTIYVENSGVFKNLLGITQTTEVVVNYQFGARSNVSIFEGLLSVSANYIFKNFGNLSFRHGLIFVSLLMSSSENLYNSVLTSPIRSLDYKFMLGRKIPLYCIMYSSQQRIFLPSVPVAVYKPLGKIFTNLISSLIVNYYGDVSSVFISLSKTMTLCSNLYLKKNFSFAEIYY